MIVRSIDNDDVVQLITQPDHAHLAGRIMERCIPLAARPRRKAILRAISEHDNGWEEEDNAPTVSPATSRVADFVNLPILARHAVWPRGVARLSDDPWAAALVAQHAITVYDRFRADAAWASFFADMESARSAMLRASGLPIDDLMADYPFVRLGDLISLTSASAGPMSSDSATGSSNVPTRASSSRQTCLVGRRFRSKSTQGRFAISCFDRMRNCAMRSDVRTS